GRALHKGDTLYVEAESADGSRAYSWSYGETPLTGEVNESCQLVGAIDFTQPTLASAR
ncbi:MAG: hypothetical protein JO102_07045, partial [Elusimicrobia bacterium]|nr:hypothetical protein [Elusimicrobiota bacterium]